MDTRAIILSSVMLFTVISVIHGHGYMISPPSRNSMWRFDFNNPPNFDDTQLFCGGKNKFISFIFHQQFILFDFFETEIAPVNWSYMLRFFLVCVFVILHCLLLCLHSRSCISNLQEWRMRNMWWSCKIREWTSYVSCSCKWIVNKKYSH